MLKNFKHNYLKFDIVSLNENYNLVLGYYKIKELFDFNKDNQKIDLCVVDKNGKIVHYDTCNMIENTTSVLKIITNMFDQNKQFLIAEFDLSMGLFTKKDFYSVYSKQKPSVITEKYQICQAFFECVLANNPLLFASYLSDNLKDKIDGNNIHLMFENFVKVDTEFLLNQNEVNLIKKIKDNFYESKTYKIEFTGNKISNIVSVE